jgi:uncharacterized membrane protein YkoI
MVIWLAAVLALASTGLTNSEALLLAAEQDVVELEDVSDDEKIRWARATRIPVSDAIKTATARTPGQVIEAALHSIKGRLLYEIEIVTSDSKVVEVYVDPQSGRVVERGGKR